MANATMSRVFGGSPLAVFGRLILVSILVGVVLSALGLDPFDIVRSIERLSAVDLEHGLRRRALGVALFPARRGAGDPDLAHHAAGQRAARQVARSARPAFRRHRRGVGADHGGERVAVAAPERGRQFRLDLGDQPDAAKDQPGIELQQRGAGLDLGDRGRPANRCRRRRSAGRRPRRARKSPPACGSTSLNSGRPDSPPASRAARVRASEAGRAIVVLPTIMPSTPALARDADHVVEIGERQIGRDLEQHRRRADARACLFAHGRSRAPADRRARAPAADRAGRACWARRR